MKECAQFLCVPVRKMINKSILVGKWAKIHKQETIQPIPKAYPPETIDILRPIANLPNINKIQETAIAEMVIKDMEDNLDSSQYGNRKHTSIQHYLVKLLHRILATVDRNPRYEIHAVLCLFVDWRQAYSRQCHLLGIKSFQQKSIRPALIPLLADYFKDREMQVKWRQRLSQPRKLPGEGAMGATLGNHEFTSQTNHSATCVPVEDMFKCVDDLTVLERINLVNRKIRSYNTRQHVPSDVPIHGQFIESKDLKTQQYHNKINQ